MAVLKLLILLTIVTLALCSELDDAEQKKRATAKTTPLNSIPSAGQKPDYNYVYQQQSQAPSNSFYPNTQNQYYNQPEQPVYQPQVVVPQNQQFLPLNFVPTPGYQTKYQVVPKTNLQLVVPQSPYLAPPPLYQPQTLPPVYQQHNTPQQYVQQQYQQQSYVNQPYFSQPYLSQPSMLVYQAQNPYNYLYSNAAQQLYNYFQSNPQARYQLLYGSQSQQVPNVQEYEKAVPGPYQQNVAKDDNDLSSSEYNPAGSSYKNPYTVARTSSYKSR